MSASPIAKTFFVFLSFSLLFYKGFQPFYPAFPGFFEYRYFPCGFFFVAADIVVAGQYELK